MRVISGKAKGAKLGSCRGIQVRPTLDRVKESIFNIISWDFGEKEVLDLFAGIGSLGIECLSRGAKKVVFIESNSRAVDSLRKNLKHCGFTDQSEIIEVLVTQGIKILEGKGNKFDLIFLDPPYQKDLVNTTLKELSQSQLLREDTLIIAEHAFREKIPECFKRVNLKDRRRYGETVVSLFRADK